LYRKIKLYSTKGIITEKADQYAIQRNQ